MFSDVFPLLAWADSSCSVAITTCGHLGNIQPNLFNYLTPQTVQKCPKNVVVLHIYTGILRYLCLDSHLLD